MDIQDTDATKKGEWKEAKQAVNIELPVSNKR